MVSFHSNIYRPWFTVFYHKVVFVIGYRLKKYDQTQCALFMAIIKFTTGKCMIAAKRVKIDKNNIKQHRTHRELPNLCKTSDPGKLKNKKVMLNKIQKACVS